MVWAKIKSLFIKKAENSIDYFQLESLLNNQIQFLFLSIYDKSKKAAPALERLCARSTSVAPKSVLEHVEKQNINKEQPIIIVCENGKKSRKISQKLEAQGYKNVYFLEKGLNSPLV